MCDKVIVENGGMPKFIRDCYMNQKMCYEADDNYARALEFVPNGYRTQEICNKDVTTSPYAIHFVRECLKTQ